MQPVYSGKHRAPALSAYTDCMITEEEGAVPSAGCGAGPGQAPWPL